MEPAQTATHIDHLPIAHAKIGDQIFVMYKKSIAWGDFCKLTCQRVARYSPNYLPIDVLTYATTCVCLPVCPYLSLMVSIYFSYPFSYICPLRAPID